MRTADARQRLKRISLAAGFLVLLAVGWFLPARADGPEYRLASIATGARTGVYYYAGGTLCGLVNAQRWQHRIRCLSEQSGGSIDNLRKLRSGSADFAIVQADWQYNAVHGFGIFEPLGPDSGLRSVVSLYPEAFTVIAGPESGITRFSDLVGKRVSIGPPGSGSRATMEVVMAEMGWETGDFAPLSGLEPAEVPRAICEGEIDAAVFIIAHPNLAVEEMMTTCGARILPADDPGIAQLIEGHSYYFSYLIPGGTYPGQPDTIPAFALAASLVTTTRTAPSVVYEFVRALFGDLEAFRDAHPAFSELTVEQMLTEGLSAPLHTGALRYYEEAGLP